jgi:hypothetical protein
MQGLYSRLTSSRVWVVGPAWDFDGIISGAPALDYTGLVATHFAWLVQANTGPDGIY